MLDFILTFKFSGAIFNAVVVIIGALVGLLFGRAIPEKLQGALMRGIGLCTFYIGISGAVSAGQHAEANPLLPIISIAVGAAVGTLCGIDDLLNRAGKAVERKFSKNSDGKLAEGFVSACLLFCVGSMTVVGGINAGISGDNTIYFTKGVIDMVAAMALAVSFGAGVMLSSAFVLLFQGGIVLAAGLLQPILSEHMISEINCVGSLLIVAIGLNLIGITKIKVADYLPAIIVAMLCAMFM